MQIILYSTHCPKCKMLERMLKKKNIDYIEVNDVEEMIKLGFETVPMLSIENKVMNYAEAIKYLMEEM